MSKLATPLLLASALWACGNSTTPPGGPGADGGPDGGGADAGSDGGFKAGPPITGLTSESWTWVPIDGAVCRDGSATGIGVNLNPGSTKLMIFLEGGGACFNIVTCAGNPSTYGATSFQGDFGPGGAEGSAGIFNRNDPANPVADWSFVYIPYCTGDVHGGDNPDGGVDSVAGTQQFVGYHNVALDLARIVPTFPNATEVLLTGVSAGGFGAMLNYDQVAAAFGSVPVNLLDDSGPPMSSAYVPACLQTIFGQTWGFGATLLADCGSDCPDATDFALPYLKHIVGTHPDRAFGLLDSTADQTIRLFYGFGLDNCIGGSAMDAGVFEEGLLDTRNELAADPNFGLYVFQSTEHTSLEGSTFDSRTAGDAGYPLTSWTAEIVDGGVSNVGP
ncbi:MAG: pectin acetylesterase-family hydrolase [Myxococcales bacterium]